MRIGQIAKRAAVGVETVRFYEREGLLSAPARAASGYRQYDKDIVDRIIFIRRAKDLGFTHKEIKELLALRLDPASQCGDVKEHAQAKITEVEGKIRELHRIKWALLRVTNACPGEGPTRECPILDAFDGNGARRRPLPD